MSVRQGGDRSEHVWKIGLCSNIDLEERDKVSFPLFC